MNDIDQFLPPHRFAHDAMATTFEIIFPANIPGAEAQAAAQHGFEEVDRLERELSRFVASSDINRLRAASADESVRIGFDAMRCFQLAQEVHALTQRAFDITLGALTDFWKHRDPSMNLNSSENAEWQLLFASSGMRHLRLDRQNFSAAIGVENLQLDLGAIGKGHAVDTMLTALREWGMPAALAHGGQSSTMGYGHNWRVALRDPANQDHILNEIDLHDRALSGSGVALHGAHIIDPRSGLPATRRHAAWALAPSAALSDAISTACMLLEREEIEEIMRAWPGVSIILLGAASAPANLVFIN